jgi:uncharacterized membrane protein YqjE
VAEQQTGPGAAQSGGILHSLRNLGATLVAIVRTRLDLLSSEVEAERTRLMQIFFWGMTAIFLMAFALGMLTLLVVAVFWDTHRNAAIATLVVIYFGLGVGALLQTRALVGAGRRIFADSLRELQNDRDELEGK